MDSATPLHNEAVFPAPPPSPHAPAHAAGHSAGQNAFPPLCTLYALEPCAPQTLFFLCRLLLLRGYCGDSAVYILERRPGGEEARFCLALSEPQNQRGLSAVVILEEYGTRIASSSMLLCLAEHAVCLAAHGAVERLAAFAGASVPAKHDQSFPSPDTP